MTMTATANKSKPTLRLKLVPPSSTPPLEPALVPPPPPPPRPTPAAVPLPVSKKMQRRIDGANLRRQLIAMYPLAFGWPPKPLKVGVDKDIRALHPDFNARTLSDAMRTYVSRGGYSECLVAGAVRVDLQGNAAGVVEANQVKQRHG